MPTPLFSASLPAADVLLLLAPLLAGAAAIYCLLPRPQPLPALWGAALGGLALVLAGVCIVRVGALSPEALLFYAFSGFAVVSGALLVTQHNPARAALSFALVVLSTVGLFLLLAAPFLMAATIIIYAGAIIVTFLFVLMLAQQSGHSSADARSREPLLSTLTGFVLLGALVYVLQLSYERNDAVRLLDDLLARTEKATRDSGDLTNFANEGLMRLLQEAIVAAEQKRGSTAELIALRGQVEPLTLDWPAGKEEGQRRLAEVAAVLRRARQMHGQAQASGSERLTPLSDQSGPAANVPVEHLRYGADGRPQMPHENAAYLGRSLFTDFLLPVELGGVLLLVATVGAIAIAHRVQPERRP